MRSQRLTGIAGAIGAALILAGSASAATIVLTFEGAGNVIPVGNFYNGGAGGNLGISFSDNAFAVVDSNDGGDGNFGHEPSSGTVLFFLDSSPATMNVPAGFTTGFSFFYSAVHVPGVVNIWDGPNATGNLLATIPLPVTSSDGGDPTGLFSPLLPAGVAFSGTARSVDFGGTANQIAFDNVTLGSRNPVGVPDFGSTAALMGLAVSSLAFLKNKVR